MSQTLNKEILEKFEDQEIDALIAATEKEIASKDPFWLIFEQKLTIKTKTGELIPLILNKAQRHLIRKIRNLWKQNKIIRILILKARQLGFSTLIEAIIYSITSQIPNQNAIIIADDIDGSDHILQMSKLYQEHSDVHLKREVKKSNKKELAFEGNHSQMVIDTSLNPNAGRGSTNRLVHLSEYAFFKNCATLMLGLSQSVPSMPRTMIIKESTANGFNHFKDEWDAAENGESDYIGLFYPWFWSEEYKMKAPEDFIIGDNTLKDISKDEYDLRQLMHDQDISNINDRLYWRRWCIRNNCNGKVSGFKQEYPSTAEEAFQGSGECFFDVDKLQKQLNLRKNIKPLFSANLVQVDGGEKVEIRKTDNGDFQFYKQPSKNGQYCIGGDACSGSGTDNAALVALDKLSNDTVAVFHGKVDPDELQFKAKLLGTLLNNAVVAIENDKFGFAANEKLKDHYGNVYIQRTFDKIKEKWNEKFGWDTTSKTRPLMLGQLQEEIRENSSSMFHVQLIKECLTFCRDPKTKKVGAQDGCNDDLVVARAIAGMIRKYEPFRIKSSKRLFSEDEETQKKERFRFHRRKRRK